MTITRRRFLTLTSMAGAALALAACGGDATPAASSASAASSTAAKPVSSAAPASNAPAGGAVASTAAPASAAGSPSAAAVSSAPAASPAASGATGTGKLLMALNAVINSADPHSSISTPDFFLFQAYCDTLTRLDANLALTGGLADSWKQIDPTTWQFKLHPNVQFHNGEPFDAAAVKFSIDRLIDPKSTLSLSARFGVVKQVDVVDPLTVNVLTKALDVLLPRRMIQLYILPPKYMQSASAADFNAKPVGTGPFMVTGVQAKQTISLKANPNWWRGKPKVSDITMLQVGDAAVRAQMLKTGEANLVQSLAPDAVAALKGQGFNVDPGFAAQVRSVIMRPNLGTPLDNKLVRQAIDFAIDKAGVVAAATAGLSSVAPGQLASPGVFGYNPDVTARPYDVSMAKQLLSQAGFASGFSIKATYRTAMSGEKETGEAVIGYLDKVGIKVQGEVVETAVFNDQFINGKTNPIAIGAIGTSPLLDGDQALSLFVSSANTKFYSNPAYDTLIANSRTETDVAKREKLLQQANATLHEDLPIAPMYLSVNPFGYTNKVHGFKQRVDVSILFEEISVDA